MKRIMTFCASIVCAVTILLAANPVTAMLDRIDPGLSKKFKLEIKKGDKDYFELDQSGDKVVVRANNYVSLATGVNWYLKYHAGVHLGWNNMHPTLPASLPAVKQKERHETNLGLRYDFNYCTFSYSMPFWDWNRWEEEIDWMAMHGINLPLAAVGQECVWRNVLLRLGYTKDQVNEFISGPAFFAWWAMNNLEGWGGPNPDSWYARQEDLQKKIVKRMAEYGIKPVFPGYSGMMPHNADEMLGLNITKPAKLWNGYQRPAFLEPTDERYAEIAAIYYEELEKLFGKAEYYSMDPFHELSNAAGFDFASAGKAVMDAMKAANPQAVWVVQGWTENPREDMIRGLRQSDLLILDLFAECRPMWGIESLWQRKDGYLHHDWLFCMLENFGGNVGLHGRIDQLLENFYQTRTNPLGKNIKGIGLTMEGAQNNPVMFELMTELPWRDEQVDKAEWLKSYAKARYGVSDPVIDEAWSVLGNSIYNCPRGNNQQGPHESIFCSRPSLNSFQASSWSKMANYYDPADTKRAAELMLSVADKYKGNNNFEYDLVDIVRQSISDHARLTYNHAIADFKTFNRQGFKDNSEKFLTLIMLQDSLLATRPEFKVGPWIEYARNAGTNDAEKDLYEWNARVQVTTWGNRTGAEAGLRDYAHKEWSGMLRDFYYPRWKAYFDSLDGELHGTKAEQIDFYAMEEPWTLAKNPYATEPEGESVEVAKAVFNKAFAD